MPRRDVTLDLGSAGCSYVTRRFLRGTNLVVLRLRLLPPREGGSLGEDPGEGVGFVPHSHAIPSLGIFFPPSLTEKMC